MPAALRSLAARAYGITFAVLITGLSSYAWLQVRREERVYREMVVASAQAMVRAITSAVARDLVLEDYANLDDRLSQVVPVPGVLRLQVCELGGDVLSDVRREGDRPVPATRPDPAHLQPPAGDEVVIQEEVGGQALVIWQPVISTHRLGWLRATLDLRPLRTIVREQAIRAALLSALFIGLCLTLLYAALKGPVDAIRRLAEFARQLDRRKGETVAAPGSTAEISHLADAINYASGELASSERRLREERERLSVTLASLLEAVFTTGLDGRLRLMNRAAEQLVGLPAAEALGRPLGELVRSPPGEPGAGERLQALAGRPAPGAEEVLRIAGPAGDARTVGAVAAPLRGAAGETLGAVVVVRDLTERERLAEERRSLEAQLLQAQKMEALGHLAGGVAHDFNNILTAIIGYANIALADAPAGSPVREDLEQVLKASDRAVGLTRSLLAFGRKQPFEPLPVDLNEVVRDMEKILRRLVSEEVAVRLELAAGTPVAVADAGQLGQVLVNLVANSRDAMPRGGRLTLSSGVEPAPAPAAWAGREPPDRAVWFAVADSGGGMDAATLRRAFEPFFTTKPKGKGTGLGLAIVHGIVVQHAGAVEVESQPGLGTRVRVLLPAFDGPLPAAVAQERLAGPRGHGTILVVEDDAQVSAVVRRMLESAGYRVLAAPDGRQGLATLRAHLEEVDLVVSDVVMPELNGVELALEVRRHHASVPVLLISGYTPDVLERDGGPPPGVEVMQKPLSPQRLLAQVEALLAAARPPAAAP